MVRITNRKFWSWVGKFLLIAVPSISSGLASYAKSKSETNVKTTASYETLQKAFVDLRAEVDALQKRAETAENGIAAIKDVQSRPVFLRPPPTPVPLVLSAPDAGTGTEGVGLGSVGVMGYGSGRPHKKRAEAPPAKFEDAVQQYEVQKK